MGCLFDDAATEYLETSSVVVSVKPLTIAGWMNRVDDTVRCSLASICDDAGDVNYFALLCLATTNGNANQADFRLYSSAASGIAYSGVANTAPAAGNWFHIAGTIDSSSNKYAYIDGGKGAVEATAVTPAGIDNVSIGVVGRNSKLWYCDGIIAEVGIWDVALTEAEIGMLAAGYSPLYIRAASLKQYWPLRNMWSTPATHDFVDYMSGDWILGVGTPEDDEHPAIFYPGSAILGQEGVPIETGVGYRRPIYRGVGTGVFR